MIRLLALLAVSFCGCVLAKPLVIYDSGRSINAQPFYPYQKITTEGLVVPKYEVSQLNHFPVVTKELSVGNVQARKISMQLPQPICVIGDDSTSMQWLAFNATKLIKLNATCIVVNVVSEKRYHEIKRLLPTLQILALPGKDFATQLGVSHYPFIVINNSLSQ